VTLCLARAERCARAARPRKFSRVATPRLLRLFSSRGRAGFNSKRSFGELTGMTKQISQQSLLSDLLPMSKLDIGTKTVI